MVSHASSISNTDHPSPNVSLTLAIHAVQWRQNENWRLKFIQFTHEWIVCNLFFAVCYTNRHAHENRFIRDFLCLTSRSFDSFLSKASCIEPHHTECILLKFPFNKNNDCFESSVRCIKWWMLLRILYHLHLPATTHTPADSMPYLELRCYWW